MAWISFPLFLLMISASSEYDIPGPLCAFSAKRLCQSLVTWFRDRTEGTSNEYRGQNVLTSKEEERVRQYVREEREGKKHDISLTLTVFLLLVLYIIDYLLFICKEMLTEWTWSKYVSCLDKTNVVCKAKYVKFLNDFPLEGTMTNSQQRQHCLEGREGCLHLQIHFIGLLSISQFAKDI